MRDTGFVPKIDAPTLAEHHARRRAAIVGAAVDLLGTEGVAAVTPAAAAAGAGLARSSVYQYFPSTGALVGAAIEEMFQRIIDGLETAMAGARSPAERVTAYVDASLDAALAGHLPQLTYHGSELSPQWHDRVHDLHAALVDPLVTALADAGVAEPREVAGLVGGVVNAAATQVQHGASIPTVRHRVRAFVLGAVGVA